MTAQTLEDLYVEELKDVFDAENQLVKALPRVARAASAADLGDAIRLHLEQTKRHVARLEKALKDAGRPAKGKPCEGMKGLLKEGEKSIEGLPQGGVRDAAIIAGAQRIEHYEIAAYGTLRAFAQQLGKAEMAELLQATLDEEKEADGELSRIALRSVNAAAANGDANEQADEDEEDETGPEYDGRSDGR